MNNKINNILDLIKKNQFLQAEKLCENINEEEKTNFEFQNVFGFVLFQLGKYDESIKKWKEVVEVNSRHYLAYSNLGNAYSKKREFQIAISCFNSAIEINSKCFEAQYGLADVYSKLSDFNKAMSFLNKSIKLRPNFLSAYKSKVLLLRLLNKKDEALKLSNEILKSNPKDPQIHFEKAEILSSLGNIEESIKSYKNCYIIDPDFPFALGHLVYEKLNNCDWNNIENEIEEIKAKIIQGKKVCSPLGTLTISDSPELSYISAKKFVEEIEPQHKPSYVNTKYEAKIKIAYFSADFRDHAVGHLIARMLECHDKSKFEIYGFYFGKKNKKDDYYHSRIKKAFTKFFDVVSMSDHEIRKLSKDLKIDIAIDLMAHTGGDECRLSIFSEKFARIHVNFLGYPGTSGANFIDYIIADKVIIPEENKKFFSEKVIYLPNSYQPSEKDRRTLDNLSLKKDFKLPENKFIFCCFNSNQKILPIIYNSWMNILKRTPKSVLWLLSGSDISNKNLKSEAEKRDIDSNRIIFADKLPINEHLARLKHADLFLDTFPYNAHTSCNDAIWAGVPVITMIGKSFQSRVAASLLNTSNLKELITETILDYENKANKIANDSKYLNELKIKIAGSKENNLLFNSEVFAKNIENLFKQMLT